ADQDSLRLLSRSRFNKLRGFAGEETCHTCTLVQPVRDGHDVILWPGDNLREPFIWISWFARYPINSSTTYTGWNFLGGLNYTRHPHIYKSDYKVDWRGFLSIQNVTTSHNGTEFKGEVKEKNDIEPKRLYIKLFVIAEKEVFSGTTSSPVTSPTDTSTSQQSTAFPSKRSIPVSSPTDTTFRPKHSTGSPKSTTDDYCFGNFAIILVIIVGIISFLLGMLVMYLVLKRKKNRNRTVSNNEPDEESTSFTNSAIADDDNNKMQMQDPEYDH
ncbi:unnamed protein product, partial [Porites lobata]